MKIAMLTEGWKPFLGGGQIYVEYLSNYLIDTYGAKIDLFTRKIVLNGVVVDEEYEKINDNFSVYRVGLKGNFFNLFYRLTSLISMTFFLYKKAKIEKYDIIHAHASLPGLPAVIVGKLLKIPVVYTVHGSICLDIGKKNLCYYLEKLFYTKIKYDLLISVSKRILNYKNRNKNIKIIYPGVDIKKFDKFLDEPKYDGLNFLFVGRLEEQKGLIYLINAIGKINPEILKSSGFKLNIVGDGDLRESLTNLSEKLGLSEFINFKGKLLLDDLVLEYKKNHVFILPSIAEGQPIVVFEAFVNNLPVIATDVGDNKYFVKDNENGFIVKSREIDLLKISIEKVLKIDKMDLLKMGKNGKKIVLEKLLWENVVKQIYSEYLELIK